MVISVQSVSPYGIDVVNQSIVDQSDFLAVEDIDRLSIADGVRDRNRVTSLSDICITYISIDAERDIVFNIGVDSPVIAMNFFLTSSGDYTFFDHHQRIQCEANTHNVFYFPKTSYTNTWVKGDRRELLSINLSSSYIQKYFPENESFRGFMDAIERSVPTALASRSLVITHRMHQIIRELIEGRYDSSLRRLHIESKVFELLLLQFEQYSSLLDVKQGAYVHQKMQEIVRNAKEVVDRNIVRPYTLLELAKLVGTNEYYLKKGFKEVMGESMFAYVTRKRMEYAKQLLLDNHCNVNEVAFTLGYTDSTNFTAAFKKYYGYAPTKLPFGG